jgi:hypothetical protein
MKERGRGSLLIPYSSFPGLTGESRDSDFKISGYRIRSGMNINLCFIDRLLNDLCSVLTSFSCLD